MGATSQTNPVRRFTFAELIPVSVPGLAECPAFPVNLPPSTTINAGELLLSPAYSGTSAQQTLAITGSPTGGTITITGTNPIAGYVWTTAPIANTFTDAAVAAAINDVINGPTGPQQAPFGPASVTVVSGLVTFGGSLANYPVPLMAIGTNALTGGTTPTMTVANTTPGVMQGTASPYLGTSGSPVYISRYSVTTDSAGNITFGSSAGGIENAGLDLSMNCFIKGCFSVGGDPTKIPLSISGGGPIDSNAITKLSARFLRGSLTAGPGSTPAGVIYIP